MFTLTLLKRIYVITTIMLLIAILILITGCGSIRENCRMEGQTCDNLLGLRQSDVLNQQDTERMQLAELARLAAENAARTTELERRTTQLESDITQIKYQVYNAENSIVVNSILASSLQTSITLLQQYDSSNVTQITALQNSITAINITNNVQNTTLINLQTTNINILTQLAVLQGYNNIVAILDPCGDKPGVFDEVFVQLADGRILSSFSDNAAGNNTRFSVLTPGNFITTDNSSCKFSVVSDPQPGKPLNVRIISEHY